jgi:hypothetical protein
MECFGTTDFDNNSRLITLSAIIISGLHCIYEMKKFVFKIITKGNCKLLNKAERRIKMILNILYVIIISVTFIYAQHLKRHPVAKIIQSTVPLTA